MSEPTQQRLLSDLISTLGVVNISVRESYKAHALEHFTILRIEDYEKMKDELLELRGLKNRDKYFDSLNRSYTKGKN